VAARSKAWVCGRWDCGFEFRRGDGCLSLVIVVCCQVEVSASGWSLVQRSPAECGVSECDREASIMRGLWPTRGCCAIGGRSITQLVKWLWANCCGGGGYCGFWIWFWLLISYLAEATERGAICLSDGVMRHPVCVLLYPLQLPVAVSVIVQLKALSRLSLPTVGNRRTRHPGKGNLLMLLINPSKLSGYYMYHQG
jgi:hypothetical protein